MSKIRYDIPLDFDDDFPGNSHSKYRRKKRLKTKAPKDDSIIDDYVMAEDNLSDYSDYFGRKSYTGGEDDIYTGFEEDSYSPH